MSCVLYALVAVLTVGADVTAAGSGGGAPAGGAAMDATCGALCLYATARLRGSAVNDLVQVQKLLGPGVNGMHSLEQLADAARQIGCSPTAAHIASKDAHRVPTPFIAHTRRIGFTTGRVTDHFVVVLQCSQERATVLDSPLAPYRVRRELFDTIWTGDALLFPTGDHEQQLVTEILRGEHVVLRLVAWCSGIVSAVVLAVSLRHRLAVPLRQIVVALRVARHSSYGAVAGALLVVAVGAVGVAYHRMAAVPQLVVNPSIVLLGVLTPGKISKQVQVTNDGAVPLVIRGVHSSCGCASVVAPSKAIAPGASDVLDVHIQVGPGPGKVEFAVASNDPRGVQRFGMLWYGAGRKILVSPPEVRQIVDHAGGYKGSVSLVVPAGLGSDVKILSMRCTEASGAVRISPGVVTSERLMMSSDPSRGVLRSQVIHVEVDRVSDRVQAEGEIVADYAGQQHVVRFPIDVRFVSTPRAEPTSLLFSVGSADATNGMRRRVKIHGSAMDIAPPTIRRAPEWVFCRMAEVTADLAILEVMVNSLPNAPIARDEIVLQCVGEDGRQQEVRVDVLGIVPATSAK